MSDVVSANNLVVCDSLYNEICKDANLALSQEYNFMLSVFGNYDFAIDFMWQTLYEVLADNSIDNDLINAWDFKLLKGSYGFLMTPASKDHFDVKGRLTDESYLLDNRLMGFAALHETFVRMHDKYDAERSVFLRDASINLARSLRHAIRRSVFKLTYEMPQSRTGLTDEDIAEIVELERAFMDCCNLHDE